MFNISSVLQGHRQRPTLQRNGRIPVPRYDCITFVLCTECVCLSYQKKELCACVLCNVSPFLEHAIDIDLLFNPKVTIASVNVHFYKETSYVYHIKSLVPCAL